MKRQFKTRNWLLGLISLIVAIAVFGVPFLFIFISASKPLDESAVLSFNWPKKWAIIDNAVEVFGAHDFMLLRAFNNSFWLTLFSVGILSILAAMVAWIIERRGGRIAKIANFLVLAGLMIPPAVVPTIFLLQAIGIYGSFVSMIFIEVAFHASFTVLLFRAFIGSIPRELDEAAILDGANSIVLFFRVIFPLLKSVIVTSIILNSVTVFNDFVNPLYFLSGQGNETVQLTLFNFNAEYTQRYNLLFMDILLITIPMVIFYAIFNKRIVAGMTAGAVKG